MGHEVSAAGIQPVKGYTELVEKWPLPVTRTDARAFLGKVGYYRRFIKDFSAIAAPWSDVTGKQEPAEEKKPLEVTEAMKRSFEHLKDQLLKAPILAYPQFDSNEPFILDTDWSLDANAIGGVLSQVQEGKERVIAYAGKKLSKSQRNYPSIKGEAAAILHMVGHFKYYLLHRPFVVRTDNQALKWMRTMEPLDRMVARWLATLANYDFTIVHRPGLQHGNADAISRAPHIAGQPESLFEVGTDGLDAITTNNAEQKINAVGDLDNDDVIPNLQWSPEELRRAQQEDEDLSQLLRWKEKRSKPDPFSIRAMSGLGQIYAGLYDDLFIDNLGLLRYRQPAVGPLPGKVPLCLPKQMWNPVIDTAHQVGAHLATDKTVLRLRDHVYFPNMRREVAGFIDTCLPCQAKKRPGGPQRHTAAASLEGFPFQRISIDFVGPLQRSKKGHVYILTVKDCSPNGSKASR